MNNDESLWTYHQTTRAIDLEPGHLRQDMLYRKIAGLISKGKILEIGFGDGYLLGKLSVNYDCCGADISKQNVEQMKERYPLIDFRKVSDNGKLPYENDLFDIFVASEVLEHMNDNELSICVAEIRRVLKRGGFAVITVPAEENLKNNEVYCPSCGLVFHKYGHKQSWDIKKIKQCFEEFKILKIVEYFNKYTGENLFQRIFGNFAWLIQTALNIITKFPGRIFTNKIYVIILKK